MVIRFAACMLAGGALLQADAAVAPPWQAAATSPTTPAETAACTALTGATLGKEASVVKADVVPTGTLRLSDGRTVGHLVVFCRVQGVSRPTADSTIRFEVWLPRASAWNQKFLSAGEGGFAGRIAYGGSGADGSLDENLRRGYATASTDTGHDDSDTHFAIGHPERGVDYLYRAKHLTTVAAKAIIARYYGRPPTRSYFSSCSNGGREGLIEAQRFPADFDGLIVGAPWNRQSRSLISHLWMRQLLSVPGASIPADKLPMLHAAVLRACDVDDGLADGVIGNPPVCRFMPRTLECKGADGPHCLTSTQVSALERIYDGPRDPRDGSSIFAPYVRGQETETFGRPDRVSGFPEQYVANFVNGDPQWDPRSFSLARDMASIVQAGRAGDADADATDFSAARRRGVKIIQYHGWSDLRIQPGNSTRYYDQVVRANGGLGRTRGFYRLFMVPGMGHCAGGAGASNFGGVGQQLPPVRDGAHDLVTALEDWVEKGVAPRSVIATRYVNADPATRTVQLQRRLCPYPEVSRYKGVGDPNDAGSFTCMRQRP